MKDMDRLDSQIEELFVDAACCGGLVEVALLFSHLEGVLKDNLRYHISTDGESVEGCE